MHVAVAYILWLYRKVLCSTSFDNRVTLNNNEAVKMYSKRFHSFSWIESNKPVIVKPQRMNVISYCQFSNKEINIIFFVATR